MINIHVCVCDGGGGGAAIHIHWPKYGEEILILMAISLFLYNLHISFSHMLGQILFSDVYVCKRGGGGGGALFC